MSTKKNTKTSPKKTPKKIERPVRWTRVLSSVAEILPAVAKILALLHSTWPSPPQL